MVLTHSSKPIQPIPFQYDRYATNSDMLFLGIATCITKTRTTYDNVRTLEDQVFLFVLDESKRCVCI